ncbi:DUF3298 and DUF4163 domain-containing protein [Qipengyuania sp. SS22]|uniref:DUF3298 and DUF4163 domain-containing protein n=1 Tax=Qipengyuania sp. SS22 TaxID=2979461 RepID=UPI0021E60770|nr:DUF3298 and DUF4163 domain-containing protein [Qipengyuania sp. SS22]UYH55221.1 DUF3298 and DUF4163 domain-containing protein [Qipengyuania sp. SS22]
MRAPLFLISLALSSAACSDSAEYADKAGVSSNATASASATANASATATPAAEAQAVEQEAERYQFAYSWPAEVAAEPALAAFLGQKADAMRAALEQGADEDWDSSEGGEWTPRQHSATEEWQVVADIPDYLSLSGHLATYSGGAHGMYGVQSLVWDRKAGKAMKGVELFNSPVALEQALGNRLCDTLNTAREERRGMEIEEGSDDMFDKCPGLDEASVLVGSSNGKTFDRITVYFGPYVAGAYAEGDYELDFPVTASVVDAVKPAHAGAFSVKR